MAFCMELNFNKFLTWVSNKAGTFLLCRLTKQMMQCTCVQGAYSPLQMQGNKMHFCPGRQEAEGQYKMDRNDEGD